MNGCINLRIPTIVLYELERALSKKGHLDDIAARRATKKLADSFLRRTGTQPMNFGDEGIMEYCAANGINTLCTQNVRDFPESEVLRGLTMSEFLIALDQSGFGCLKTAINKLIPRFNRPRLTEAEYLEKLERICLAKVAELIRTKYLDWGPADFAEHPHR